MIWLTNTPPSGYSHVEGHVHYVANDLYTSLSNTKVYPYLSSIFEVGGIKYVPVSPSERTCDAIDCIYTGEAYDVKIDNKVNYKGIDLTVKAINPYIGYGCSIIKKVDISLDADIPSYAFYNCDNLSSVTLDSKIKSLGEYAFRYCSKLKQFIIPDSVTTLNSNLLSGCSSLESIKIHKGVKDIKDHVFDGCTNLSTVIIEDRDTPLNLGSNYGSPLFSDCKLDSVYIGGKIVYNTSSGYGYSPFYRNTSLRSVKISDAETTIYDNEFYGCTNLQNVSIGDSVKSIGNWAFSGCSGLNHFAFGSGLQSIGQEAFSDCNNVTEISSEALVPPTCGTNALDDINKWTCKLTVPKASMEAYKQAEQWKEFFFIEENTTGIQTMTSDTELRSDVYSLTGAKVLANASLQDVQSLPKGIYVIKGKKIIVK